MPAPESIPSNGFRTFVIVWITQSVSVFGSALTVFAINIWLTQTLYPLPEQKPQLALALSAVNLAFALPVVFGAPLAGAWADRHDRKHTMIVMDFASGLLSLALVALILTENLSLWLLVILIVVFAITSAFHSAAFDTSYVMIVPEAQLPRANGMMQTMWSLSGVLSPVIAASLIAIPALARQGKIPGGIGFALSRLSDGTALAIGIDAFTFFIASVVLLFLFIPSPQRTDLYEEGGRKKKSLWSDVKIGGMYIWQRKPLLWLLGTFAVANFVGGPMAVFEPLLVRFNLSADWMARGFSFETALAFLVTTGGIGGLIGGVLVSTWGGLKTRRVYGVIIPLILGGVVQVLLGLSSYLYFASAMAFIAYGMIPLMNSHSQTIWQTQTPPELQGRVFAVRRLIAQFTWPISAALAGWAGGMFDPGMVVAILGAILTFYCLIQLFNPYLLRVEDKAFLDELAGVEAVQ